MGDTKLKFFHDIGRAQRWQQMRKRIRQASGTERLKLLRYFGDQIRALMPSMARAATVEPEDIARAMEVASTQGAVIGAWLSMDPANPTWPGRDRLFIVRHEELINTCAALAALGFFPPAKVVDLVERVDEEGRRAFVPGIESPGVPAEEIPDLMWESAVESARNKRRWRERLSAKDLAWADPAWRDSPATWRTCGLFDAADAVTVKCRDLTMRDGERPAGLVLLLKVPRSDITAYADEWASRGWETAIVNRNDCLSLYELLVSASMDKPLAVMMAVGQTATTPHISRTAIRRKESGLLGEMSDEQFNEIMGESLNF